jgi:hypothetical protein
VVPVPVPAPALVLVVQVLAALVLVAPVAAVVLVLAPVLTLVTLAWRWRGSRTPSTHPETSSATGKSHRCLPRAPMPLASC